MKTEIQLLREALLFYRHQPITSSISVLHEAHRLADAALTQPAEGGEAREFFAYHSDMGVEFFNGPDAEAAAKSLCEENLKLERAEAISTDEWADDRAESIRWGVVLGRAKFFENPGQEGEDSGDYRMVGRTAPPASQEQATRYLIRARWPDGIEQYLDINNVTDLGGKVGIDVDVPMVHPLTASQEQAECAKAAHDALMTGTGFMRGGKHIPLDQVFADPPKGSQEQAQQPDHLPDAGKMVQQPSGIKSDFGPWSVSMDGQYIDSDDFEHDVKLVVRGDFRDDVQRRLYACDIAQRLSQQPSGGEVPGFLLFSQRKQIADDAGVQVTADTNAVIAAALRFLRERATPKPEPMTQAMPQDMGHTTIMGDCIYAGIFEDEISEVKSAVVIKFESDDKLRDFLRWHHGITKGEA